MNATPDRLYNLLPVVYRQRDYEQGGVLKALLGVIAEQVDVVEEDITELYANWFIETCQDWAVPYIGDLIGYQPLTPASLPDDLSRASDRTLESVLIPRREVANALALRRRKGTLPVLEELAKDLTGWPARAVEMDRRIAITHALNHPRPDRGRRINLRLRKALDRLGGAFDDASRTVPLTSSDRHPIEHRYAIPKVGLFVWTQKTYALDRVPAYCLEQAGDHCYTFSSLGNDLPLYVRSDSGVGAGDPPDFPGPIDRGQLAQVGPKGRLQASTDYYAAGKSIAVWAPGWAGFGGNAPIPAERIVPADLSRWQYEPPKGHVAVDPELGRLAFAPGNRPKGGVWVTYCYAMATELGGGPYLRRLAYPKDIPVFLVGNGAQFADIASALQAWSAAAPVRAIIEIVDSEVYAEPIRIELAAKQSLEIRSTSGARPVINLLDWRGNRPDGLMVSGQSGSEFRLDGIVILGRALELRGSMAAFSARDCTLVPGWGREFDPDSRRGNEPSLVLVDLAAHIRLERSIFGPIRTIRTEGGIEPAACVVDNCVLDARGPEGIAIGGEEGRMAGISLTIRRSAVLGQTHAHAIVLAEEAIFAGAVRVARRQQGCLRFCYLPTDSHAPGRYQCQPDLADQAMARSLSGESLDAAERSALLSAERNRVKPVFDSMRYGDPGYARLAERCPREIKRGAEDGSEMGVFHDLFEPQRLALLVAAVRDFVPLDVQSSVIFVD